MVQNGCKTMNLFCISSYDCIAVKQNEMIYSLPTQGMILKISDGI